MGLKLYKARVCVNVELMIAGDEPPDNDEIMTAVRRELAHYNIIHKDRVKSDVAVIASPEEIAPGCQNLSPYGNYYGDKTCLQILEGYDGSETLQSDG